LGLGAGEGMWVTWRSF